MRGFGERVLNRLGLSLLAMAVLSALVACNGKPTATPAGDVYQTPVALPERSANETIRPDEGGTVALNDGAEVVFARQAVSAATAATLRVLDKPPAVPMPRSLIGRAYQLSLEGGDLAGVALVTLPLPQSVSLDAYDLAPYRWNGQTWERLTPRIAGAKVQFGAGEAAIFALQGQWRLADAALALAIPSVEPGRPSVPVAAVGQYRYSALPALQGEYVAAHLTLKRDSSGGAGQVSGDETRDETVAKAGLLFKPDPAQAQGVIEFSYVFEVKPGDVKAPPASVSRLYAVLTVDDSIAPTRRFSSGVEYTQLLPIQVAGAEVVRPDPLPDTTPPLRWNVRLNGYPLVQKPATEPTLPLPDVLAEGGLGEYRITLEAQLDGKWIGVSNEVTVQLRLPATPTPSPTPARPTGTAGAVISIPTAGTGTPGGLLPPTPTRRPAPDERTPTPSAGPSPTVTSGAPTFTPTPTRPSWASIFWADNYVLAPNGCTMLHWNVENVDAVLLDGGETTGKDDRQVCPSQTTTYTLRAVSSTGTQDRTVTILVREEGEVAVVFTADSSEIVKGKCTTLRWWTADVTAVYLNDGGVAGVASKEVCPETTTQYELRVEAGTATPVRKRLTITVLAAEKVPMRFWAEQYTFPPDECTTLHWSVQGVEAVYLEGISGGAAEGVTGVGTRQICPTSTQPQYYTLRVEVSSDYSQSKQITLQAISPTLAAGEIIAQGLVKDVVFVTDLDSNLADNQPGWELTVEGVHPLFTGSGSTTAVVVKLPILQTLAEIQASGPIDWPINPSQLIEFRAVCVKSACSRPTGSSFYVRLRSD
ncbi:MAG: hypothetical protein NT169_21935 [Chloroflexi bacterium]|nr:hypothetical protein [Chloroflexota bacterium]